MFFVNGEHQGFAAELIAEFESFRAFASPFELRNAGSYLYWRKANRLLQMQKHSHTVYCLIL